MKSVLTLCLFVIASTFVVSKSIFAKNRLPYLNDPNFSILANQSILDTLIIDGTAYNKKDLHLKSPTKAFLLALGPGFFIRGAGHIYAKRYRTASYIFMSSAVSLYGMKIIDSIGESPDAASLALFSASILLFVGSWMYDWMIAPAICERDNQKIIKSLQRMLFFEIRHNCPILLGFELKYKF